MRQYWLPALLSASVGVLLAGCAGSERRAAGSGGAASTGGLSNRGGTTGEGGTITTGGVTAQSGSGSGGAASSGGATTTVSGGASAGGRSGSGGGAGTGGASGSGGETASGGRPGAGGRTGTGGSKASGGTTVTGGSPSAGGASGSGGARTTGGRPASGGATGTGGTTGAGGSSERGKWRIMPLGDSITGTTCYPKLLSQELIGKGHANFELIGSVLNNQGCGSAPNVQTEGHGGYLVTYLMTDSPPQGGKGKLSELRTWAAEKPDVVLMEYGTNDVWSSIATQTILDAYSLVVDQFRTQKPDVIFFVAQITPLNPSGCGNCEANVEALNGKIPAWASGKSTTASPIHVVDVWASLPAASYTPNSTYTSDGCHPNPAGSQLMADAWYEGITAQGIP